ncbi:MAG: barstar family protein [Clostridia bacterium]|nr:barstar family protein [Clostridia bacterium]
MKEIILDGACMTSVRTAHAHIADRLDFPAYYGGNLDALADCLSELPSNLSILVEDVDQMRENLSDYADVLLVILNDKANEVGFRLTIR